MKSQVKTDISFPIQEFLQKSRDLHLISFLLIFFFLGLYILSPSFQSVFSIIISILVAFYIAIFSTEYAIFRNKFLEVNHVFSNIFDEIIKNRTRVDEILKQMDALKDAWIQLEKNRWIGEKTIVREPYSTKSGFIYQYLPNNAFKVLQSHNFDQIIIGADDSQSGPNYYHQLSRFYFHCIKTSEKTQRIEDEINDFILLIEKNIGPIDNKKEVEKIIDGSGNLHYLYKELGYGIDEFNDLFICGKFDQLNWSNFVTRKVKEIVECFEKFNDKERIHCPDLCKIVHYDNFFHTIVDQNILFPPDLISQLVGVRKNWAYIILISSVLAIWSILLLIIGFCSFLHLLLSGFFLYLTFFVLFIIFFCCCFVFQRIFFNTS